MTTPMFAMEPATIAAIAAAGISLISGIGGAIGAGAQRRKAERKERAATARRIAAEANRQDIPDFQQDLANPYANLQVATQAAAMQAEQQDIALASTLDTLRATGASAGGATALARAAAQSKRGVAASIEQQEARNAQLRAQGEMQAAQIRQKGQVYAFQTQEAREMTELDRQASLESSYNQQAAAYGAQSRGMAVQAVGSAATLGLQAYTGGMFKGKTPETPKITPTTTTSAIAPSQVIPPSTSKLPTAQVSPIDIQTQDFLQKWGYGQGQAWNVSNALSGGVGGSTQVDVYRGLSPYTGIPISGGDIGG